MKQRDWTNRYVAESCSLAQSPMLLLIYSPGELASDSEYTDGDPVSVVLDSYSLSTRCTVSIEPEQRIEMTYIQ